jgi:hypothetical protein
MLSQSKVAKLTAKAVFSGKKIKMLAIGSILTFCILALYCFFLLGYPLFPMPVVIAFCVAFCVLWIAPLTLGVIRTLCQEVFGDGGEIINVFYYFSSFNLYKRAIWFIAVWVFKVGIAIVICLAPAISISVVTDMSVQSFIGFSLPIWLSGLHVLGSLFTVLGLIVAFFWCIRYFAAPFLFVGDEEGLIMGTFYKATRLSKMGYIEFLSLIASFIPWFVLGAFCFFLPYVLPYFLTSAIALCRFTVYGYNKKIKMNTFDEVKN